MLNFLTKQYLKVRFIAPFILIMFWPIFPIFLLNYSIDSESIFQNIFYSTCMTIPIAVVIASHFKFFGIIKYLCPEEVEVEVVVEDVSEELLEDFIISLLREFSNRGFKDFSTGFQRYYARDLLEYLKARNRQDLLEVITDRGFYTEMTDKIED